MRANRNLQAQINELKRVVKIWDKMYVEQLNASLDQPVPQGAVQVAAPSPTFLPKPEPYAPPRTLPADFDFSTPTSFVPDRSTGMAEPVATTSEGLGLTEREEEALINDKVALASIGGALKMAYPEEYAGLSEVEAGRRLRAKSPTLYGKYLEFAFSETVKEGSAGIGREVELEHRVQQLETRITELKTVAPTWQKIDREVELEHRIQELETRIKELKTDVATWQEIALRPRSVPQSSAPVYFLQPLAPPRPDPLEQLDQMRRTSALEDIGEELRNMNRRQAWDREVRAWQSILDWTQKPFVGSPAPLPWPRTYQIQKFGPLWNIWDLTPQR
ncbi:MAG: hypothetical protein AAB403_24705 [Planctomycetota bacterium]